MTPEPPAPRPDAVVPQLMVRADFALGGKGVVVVNTAEELYAAVSACLDLSPTASLTVRRVTEFVERSRRCDVKCHQSAENVL